MKNPLTQVDRSSWRFKHSSASTEKRPFSHIYSHEETTELPVRQGLEVAGPLGLDLDHAECNTPLPTRVAGLSPSASELPAPANSYYCESSKGYCLLLLDGGTREGCNEFLTYTHGGWHVIVAPVICMHTFEGNLPYSTRSNSTKLLSVLQSELICDPALVLTILPFLLGKFLLGKLYSKSCAQILRSAIDLVVSGESSKGVM